MSQYCHIVVLSLSRDGLDKLFQALQDFADSNQNHVLATIEKLMVLFQKAVTTSDTASGSATYHWSDLKWDAGSLDIKFLEAFLKSLPNYDYSLLKMGENLNHPVQYGIFTSDKKILALARAIDTY
jgi:hypothetical protein